MSRRRGTETSRVLELRAQLSRARLHYDQAVRETDPVSRHALLIACVYPARSVIELMREAAKSGALTISLTELDSLIRTIAPGNRLIRKLRIRDFHHAPVRGPGHTMLEHEITLPPFGQALITLDVSGTGPALQVTGSKLEAKPKFFLTAHDFVQDELQDIPIRLEDLLRTHFAELDVCIVRFADLQRSAPPK